MLAHRTYDLGKFAAKTAFVSMNSWLVLVFVPPLILSIDCSQLKSNQDIVSFVKAAKNANPLMSTRISVLIESSPCENELCSGKNRKKRQQNREIVHVVRIYDNKRLNFLKGENSPHGNSAPIN